MCFSLVGLWMQNIAQPWLALSLTDSAFLVSVVSASQFTPPLLLTLFAGSLVDRLPKKNVMQVTQTTLMIVAFIFSFLVFTDRIQYYQIIILAVLTGIANAFDAPCRQAIVVELLESRTYLPNAIALNSMAFNAARVIGPSVAGVLIATLGIGYCFLINALSYVAILTSLFFVRTYHKLPQKLSGFREILHDIRLGFSYVKERPEISSRFWLLLIVATFIPNFNIITSAYARFNLGGSETAFAYLMTAMGVGSLIGALAFAAQSSQQLPLRKLAVFPMFAGLFMALSGFSSSFVLSCLLMALIGFFFVSTSTRLNSGIQMITDHNYRGRVMSIYALIFTGSTPFGNLYAGSISELLNPAWGYIACGGAVLIGVPLIFLYYNRRPKSSDPDETPVKP